MKVTIKVACVGIANAISKPGVFGHVSIAGQLFQTSAVSIKSGGREASSLLNTAQVTRAIFLARATAST